MLALFGLLGVLAWAGGMVGVTVWLCCVFIVPVVVILIVMFCCLPVYGCGLVAVCWLLVVYCFVCCCCLMALYCDVVCILVC